MKKPKLPPMPEIAPAPTPPQTPTMAGAASPAGSFSSMKSPGFMPPLGSGMMLSAVKRAGRKSLIGG